MKENNAKEKRAKTKKMKGLKKEDKRNNIWRIDM
jgi:hypothetical protein